jgi:uncharacterized protein YqgV (UPF0045/DUF77 family)
MRSCHKSQKLYAFCRNREQVAQELVEVMASVQAIQERAPEPIEPGAMFSTIDAMWNQVMETLSKEVHCGVNTVQQAVEAQRVADLEATVQQQISAVRLLQSLLDSVSDTAPCWGCSC